MNFVKSLTAVVAAAALCAAMSPGYAASPLLYSFSTFRIADADETYPSDINNRGEIVGDVGRLPSEHFTYHGFFKSDIAVRVIDGPGALGAPFTTGSRGINDNGTIVGDYLQDSDPIRGRAYVLNGSTFTPFDAPKSSETSADAINNRGDIAGTAYFASDPFPTSHAFILKDGKYTFFDAPNAEWNGTSVSDMNDVGQVVVSAGITTPQSYIYDGSGFTSVAIANSESTYAAGINNAGIIVGSYADRFDSPLHGFLKSGNDYYRVDEPIYGLKNGTGISGINDRGQLVGTVYDEFYNRTLGFVATPCASAGVGCVQLALVPESSTYLMMVVGLGMLICATKATRRRADGDGKLAPLWPSKGRRG